MYFVCGFWLIVGLGVGLIIADAIQAGIEREEADDDLDE